MFCEKCGQQLRDGAKFCNHCGAPVQSDEMTSVVSDLSSVHQEKRQNENSYRNIDKPRKSKMPVLIASVAGVVLIAGIILTVVLLNAGKSSVDYKRVFKAYRNEIEAVKDDIDSYADSMDMNDEDRKLISVYDVFDKDDPELLYVVQGKDCYDNDAPVIRVNTVSGDEMNTVYESYVEDSLVDSISLLKNSSTGEIYLFSDFESPDSGNVIIYRLTKEKDTVQQDEQYKLRYYWEPDGGESSYVYEYYVNEKSVSEEDYNAQIDSFVKTIDTVIISSNVNAGGHKYDYFKDVASVAMSYDEMMDYLDNGINATPDEVKPKTKETAVIEEYEEPTEAPKIHDVDPAELPESLTRFLQQFDFAYISGSSYDVKEFDCEDLDGCYDYLVNHIASNPTCVDGTLYPGGEEKKIWESNADPLGKFGNMATLEYPKEKLMWMLENIFHISEADAQDMLQAALDADEMFYEYDQDGTTYLYRATGGVGGPGFNISYETVRYDGKKYYFVYDATYGNAANNNDTAYVYYAEMAQEEIDGETYWTMYKHTSDIPVLPEANTGELSDEEIFSIFEGSYTFTSGAGAWATFLELNSDGTFTGEFHDTDAGVRGEGYDATYYYAKFSGRFLDPEKINSFTYSFKLDEINYENEPGTEEIGDPFGNLGDIKMLIKYSTAYGLSGSETVYAYTPSAPTAKLPDGFMSWVDHLRDKSTRYDPELSYKCLYAVETEQGWIGEKAK